MACHVWQDDLSILFAVNWIRVAHLEVVYLVASSNTRHRPVHQEKIQILQAKVVESGVQTLLYLPRLMVVIPQLRRHPDIIPLKPQLGQSIRNALANLFLITINSGAIKVAVTSQQGRRNRRRHVGLIQVPRSEAEKGHHPLAG